MLVWSHVDEAGSWLGSVIDGACGSCQYALASLRISNQYAGERTLAKESEEQEVHTALC